MLLHALQHACVDTLRLFPFLLVTYLFMEWLEHGAGARFERAIARGGRLGPLFGALLGIIPQCGFSGAAATLYAGRVITFGTLFAVFFATSDEMLPIMVSSAAPPALIAQVLGVKVVAGIVFGLVLDAVLRRLGRLHTGLGSKRRHEGHSGNDIHELCEEEGCSCRDDEQEPVAEQVDSQALEEAGRGDWQGEALVGEQAGGHGHNHDHDHGHEHGHSHGRGSAIVLPALRHSLNITVFVFTITLLIDLVVEMGLESALADITTAPYLSSVVAGVLGLIPNCAISVGMTQLYLGGLMSGGALIAGLSANAGIGLVVLFRTNRDVNENLKVMGVMLALSVLTGIVVEALGLF